MDTNMFDRMFGTMRFQNSKDRRNIEEMFGLYMEDIPSNFYENQFTLAKKYEGTDYADWVRILKHPAFDSWKQEQIALIATTETDKALAGKGTDKEAVNLLKVRSEVLNSEKKIEKPTIIVIPTELYFREADDDSTK